MINIAQDFPILSTKVHGKQLVYLDSAATAQKPRAVIDVVNELHMTCNANIHRGIHYLAEQTTERYESAREKVRRFINAGSTSEIVFTSGATASRVRVSSRQIVKHRSSSDTFQNVGPVPKSSIPTLAVRL